jgi:hypothetical protein
MARKGWMCPSCERVYAPDVKVCEPCNVTAKMRQAGKTATTASLFDAPAVVLAYRTEGKSCS